MWSPGAHVQERYVIEHVLGRGGMADVFRARHVTLGTTVALKVLHVESASVERRLVQEAQVQARLRSPHLVQVLDVFRETGRIVVVMEFAEGGSLDAVLKLVPSGLAAEPWVEIADGLLDGLSVAHAAGVVHRDLKPENLLLAEHGGVWTVQIADFGIAKALGADSGGDGVRTRIGATMGTPAYMSPEQVDDAAQVTPASDVFSAGATLYALATGRSPFHARDAVSAMRRVREDVPIRLSLLRPDLPSTLAQVVDKALAKVPAHRYADAARMRAAWQDALPDTLRGVRGHLRPPRPGEAPVTGDAPSVEQDWFVKMKRFIAFDDTDEHILAQMAPLFEAHGDDLTDRFYARLLEQPETALLLEGRLTRLKRTHRQWLRELFGGLYDDAYLQNRMRIGHAHVRVRLAPVWVEAVMSFVRVEGQTLIVQNVRDPAICRAASGALMKILDLDLMVIHRAYDEARLERIASFSGIDRDLLDGLVLRTG